jgi:hypothetical protein
MMALYSRHNQRRRARYSSRLHEIREEERRGVRGDRAIEPVVAHEPPHPTGCLTCMVARMEQVRNGDQA